MTAHQKGLYPGKTCTMDLKSYMKSTDVHSWAHRLWCSKINGISRLIAPSNVCMRTLTPQKPFHTLDTPSMLIPGQEGTVKGSARGSWHPSLIKSYSNELQSAWKMLGLVRESVWMRSSWSGEAVRWFSRVSPWNELMKITHTSVNWEKKHLQIFPCLQSGIAYLKLSQWSCHNGNVFTSIVSLHNHKASLVRHTRSCILKHVRQSWVIDRAYTEESEGPESNWRGKEWGNTHFCLLHPVLQ